MLNPVADDFICSFELDLIMNLGAFVENFRLIFIWALLRHNMGSDCAGQSTPEALGGSQSTAPGAVVTCSNYKIATQSRQLSQEWIFENTADRLNISDGKWEGSEAVTLANGHFGNWSFALIASRRNKMAIEYNVTVHPLDLDLPNSFIGWAIMHGANFTTEFSCYDLSPRESGWSGRCSAFMKAREKDRLAETDLVTVSVNLSLLYINVLPTNATGVGCEDLRLHALRSADGLVLAKNSTSESFAPAAHQLHKQYSKIWKHRICLEWSVPYFSRNLKDAVGSKSFRTLAEIRLSKEDLGTDWDIDIELQYRPNTKIVETTLTSMGLSSDVRVLNVTRQEIAFSDCENLVKSVPRDKIDNFLQFFWFSSRIADGVLAKLANGTVVMLEYEVIYGLTKPNAELTTGNGTYVN